MTPLLELSALDLVSAYRARSVSPIEAVDAALARIEALNPELGAFTTVAADRAVEEARQAERSYASASAPGPLTGVPFAVKDLFDTAGVRTTYGSPIFDEHVPATDAVAVGRMRDAGAILIGKAQTHEFAWGITSVNELMGTSRNPWRTDLISGGSSGGCAVALAADMVPLAIGSDTGGSIRVPSSLCGTVGYKPTYGRLDATGAMPLAPSLDHVGAMARTPADAALLLAVMEGGPPPPARADARLDGLTIGICRDLHLVPPTPAVESTFDAALAILRELGADVVELSLPEADRIRPAFVAIQMAEALGTHVAAGLWPARRDEYGDDVRGRLEQAEKVSLADYAAATATRERLRAAVGRLFERADVLLTPVTAGPAPTVADELAHRGGKRDFREIAMPYTVPHDLLGLPVCALRAGFDDEGLPIGVQLAGAPWTDARVLNAADALFAATPGVQQRRPSIGAPAAET